MTLYETRSCQYRSDRGGGPGIYSQHSLSKKLQKETPVLDEKKEKKKKSKGVARGEPDRNTVGSAAGSSLRWWGRFR